MSRGAQGFCQVASCALSLRVGPRSDWAVSLRIGRLLQVLILSSTALALLKPCACRKCTFWLTSQLVRKVVYVFHSSHDIFGLHFRCVECYRRLRKLEPWCADGLEVSFPSFVFSLCVCTRAPHKPPPPPRRPQAHTRVLFPFFLKCDIL